MSNYTALLLCYSAKFHNTMDPEKGRKAYMVPKASFSKKNHINNDLLLSNTQQISAKSRVNPVILIS